MLLPGSADQVVPHTAAVGGLSSNPLKSAGAGPALGWLSFDHRAPQNVTLLPNAESWSAITKLPPAALPNTRTSHEVLAVEPPTSSIVVVIAKDPAEAYVWLPLTTKGPPVGPETVPWELEPSPQLIVAVKSEAVPFGFESLTLATGPLND